MLMLKIFCDFIGLGMKATKMKKFKTRMIRLKAGTGATFDIETNHSDNALMACYQPKFADEFSSAAILLLEKIFDSNFYNDLRTNQQLGYIATIDQFQFVSGVRILCFSVESSKYDSARLWQKIEKFVEKIRSQLNSSGINATEFQDYKKSVQKLLLQKPINRETLRLQNWKQIFSGEFKFDLNQKLGAEVFRISVEEFVKFYENLVSPIQRRLILLKTKSKFPDLKVFDQFETVKNYQNLKQKIDLEFYET